MKEIIKIVFPIILFLGVGFMLFKTFKKIEQKNTIALQIKKIPDFEFLEIQSNEKFSSKSLKKDIPVLFVYFNTECEHCRYEIKQISHNINKFENCQIIMISIEEPEILKTFTKKHNLLNKKNITILYDKDLMFEEIFGNCPFPTSFIYNKKRELVKTFKGEVKIEALLKYLNE